VRDATFRSSYDSGLGFELLEADHHARRVLIVSEPFTKNGKQYSPDHFMDDFLELDSINQCSNTSISVSLYHLITPSTER
jgi:hypothetical protein